MAAGVTTGYFWRAAFEASPSTHPVSAPVNIVEPTPKPPGSLDGQTEACGSHSSYRPEPGGRHFQPVRAFHHRDAVAERPTDSSATSRPRGRPCRPRRRLLRRLSRARRRRPSRLRPDHSGPDDAGLTCEGARRGRDSTAAGRHAAARSAASSHQGRRRWGRRRRTPRAKAAMATTARTSPGWGHGDENHDHSGPKGHGG